MTVIYEVRFKEHRDIKEMGLSTWLIGLRLTAHVLIPSLKF